jgi:hypothetical protein
MSDSLAPLTYYTTSNNTGIIAQEVYTIDTATMANISAASSSLGNITISNGSGSTYYTGAGIGGSGTISIGSTTISGAGTSTFNWKRPEEFVDAFPDYNRIEKMCKEYPGLAIAFEKFKTVYNLVKDHYDTPEDKRPKP